MSSLGIRIMAARADEQAMADALAVRMEAHFQDHPEERERFEQMSASYLAALAMRDFWYDQLSQPPSPMAARPPLKAS